MLSHESVSEPAASAWPRRPPARAGAAGPGLTVALPRCRRPGPGASHVTGERSRAAAAGPLSGCFTVTDSDLDSSQ